MALEGSGDEVGKDAALYLEAVDEAEIFIGVVGVDGDDLAVHVVGLPLIGEEGVVTALIPGRKALADGELDIGVVGDDVAEGSKAGVEDLDARGENGRCSSDDAGAGDRDLDDWIPVVIHGLGVDEVDEFGGVGDGHIDARPVGVGDGRGFVGGAVLGVGEVPRRFESVRDSRRQGKRCRWWRRW